MKLDKETVRKYEAVVVPGVFGRASITVRYKETYADGSEYSDSNTFLSDLDEREHARAEVVANVVGIAKCWAANRRMEVVELAVWDEAGNCY